MTCIKQIVTFLLLSDYRNLPASLSDSSTILGLFLCILKQKRSREKVAYTFENKGFLIILVVDTLQPFPRQLGYATYWELEYLPLD